MSDLACPACGDSRSEPHWQMLLRCTRCRLIFADARIDAEEVRRLYGHGYFHGGEYWDYESERSAHERTAERNVCFLERLVPERGRLVEVGSAYGYFLARARTGGWEAVGYDVSEAAARGARERLGVDARAGDFVEEPGPADAVCMWDTIQHLTEPARVVRHAARILRPGGVLALTTGDAGSLNARLRKQRWRLVHPPTHLTYFSAATLGRLLESAGLEVVSIDYPPVYRRLGSMLHQIAAAWPDGALRRRVQAIASSRRLDRPVALNLFDIMRVAARKR